MLGFVLVFLVTLLSFLWWRSKPNNYPPSPGLSLPVVGHLHLFKSNPVEQIHDWRRRLGDVYSIQMGPFSCVMVSGYRHISELLLKHHNDILERPNNFSHEEIFEYAGVISLGGEKWKEQRTFLQSTLRSMGMGKNIMAERIMVESEYLVASLEELSGEPTNIEELVTVCVTNIICGVVFGKRFSHTDESIRYWIGFVKRLFKLLGSSAEINFFPVLKYIPGDRFHYKELSSILKDMRATLRNWMDLENREVNVSDESFKDLVQAYITEIERQKQDGSKCLSIDDSNLLSSIMSLFNAGTETTANTIVFGVLYLVNFPEIQERVYQEIINNVGTDRYPDVSDKTKLKYLTAFIMEAQRYAGVVPIGIDRLSTKDIKVEDYNIPKGTTFMVNFDSLLRDASIWGDPENFRPERFLDGDGSVIVKKEYLPFGIGKRNCLGEALATMEIFLFLSALIQKFEFVPEDKEKKPTMVPNVGFSRCAKSFKVRALPRKD